jgi:undecaprenyl-diphosphatase
MAGESLLPLAWYRIAFGLLVFATAWSGTVNWQG